MAALRLCGTLDLQRVYYSYSNFMGTANGTLDTEGWPFYVVEASNWFLQRLRDFEMSPPAADPVAGTYDHHIRECVACRAVYMAADSIERRQAGYAEEVWWDSYNSRAEDILDKLRKGEYRLSYQTPVWQSNIGPAQGVANGTVNAPAMGIMDSNGGYSGAAFTGNSPRTYVVELSGAGSLTEGNTFQWKYKGDADWQQTGISIQNFYWWGLDCGVSVTFKEPLTGTVETGMRWEIVCNPSDKITPRKGITCVSMEMG